jgi:hypothetical protein
MKTAKLCIASNNRMTANDRFSRMWKEMVIIYFKLLPHCLKELRKPVLRITDLQARI